MNAFVETVDNMEREAEARTENGMKARASTADFVLDFFSVVGGARGTDLSAKFTKALHQNEELAVRALLWTRDVRGGAGEREQFRDLLKVLELYDWNLAGSLIPNIIEVGRWDDLFSLTFAPNVQRVVETFAQALREGNGLAAKWTPRRNVWFFRIASHMGLSPRNFRKLIVGLSSTVESQMSANKWNEIDFSKVPSLASARYQKAFAKHAGNRYANFLANVELGNQKINAGAVYPHDVVKASRHGDVRAANAQWEALPDYLTEASIFPIVDTSASMNCIVASGVSAMDVAKSLGLYVASKNKSAFKDLVMIFSEDARLVQVKGSLSDKLSELRMVNSMNTNLHRAFAKILDVARHGKVPPEDMPETLLILSDMQFDSCVLFDYSAIEMIRAKYQAAGYRMPKIVFWNLSRYTDNVPVRFDENGTALVSGFSPAILEAILSENLEHFSPKSVMMRALMSPRYDYAHIS